MFLAALFGLFAVIGLIFVVLDFAAMMNDPTPSQYSMGVAQWGFIIFVVCGLISLASLAQALMSAA